MIGFLLRPRRRKLGRNELVHVGGYNDFAAMTAVEKGHPKMDVGASSVRAATVEDLVGANKAPMHLTAREVASVMDGVLARIATYFSGQMQAQTVCTSLYLMQAGSDALGAIPALAAFCANAARLCTSAVRVAAVSKVLFDDEYPVTHAKTMSVPEVGRDDAEESLAHAKQLLSRNRGACAASSDGTVTAAADDCRGIAARVGLVAEAARAMESLEGCNKAAMEKALKHIRLAQGHLQVLEGVHGRGDQGIGTVDEMVPRWMLPIPRKVVVMDQAESQAFWRQLLRDLRTVCRFGGIPRGQWGEVRDMLYLFSGTAPSLLPRTLLHRTLCWEDSAGDEVGSSRGGAARPLRLSREFLLAHWGIPVSLADADHAMGDFADSAAKTMSTWVQIMCLEQSWRHRKLRAYVPDWADLYTRAVAADRSPDFQALCREKELAWDVDKADGHGPLACWVEREACLAMVSHVLAAVELDLVQPVQYRMTFWYVDFLLGVALQNTKLLDGPGGLARLTGERAPAGMPYAPTSVRRIAALELQKSLSQGLLRMMAGLALDGTVEVKPGPFNSECEWFAQRFAAFHHLSRPDPLTYEQYVDSVDMTGVSKETMLKLGAEAFAMASRLGQVFDNPDLSSVIR